MLRGSLYIVAHPDDDLLFLSPDLIADVTKKSPEDCFTVVFVTSGDAGKGDQYAAGREKGIRTAYGNLIVCDGSGGSQDWNRSTGGEPDHHIDIFYFQCAPSYRLVFMKLPDGDYQGDGYAATSHETLTKLYSGDIHAISSTLVNVDNQATRYTLPMLKAALSSIISAVMPTRVRTMDWLGDTRVPKDHSDHYTVGKLVRDVMLDFKSISLIGSVPYSSLCSSMDLLT
jgi:LmbE family N-acetylglucosaminyl deacetylase